MHHLDNDGIFTAETSEHFKKQFSFIFKNLREVLNLFSGTSGNNGTAKRESEGHDRLYFVSLGPDCYFLLVSRPQRTNYEVAPGMF